MGIETIASPISSGWERDGKLSRLVSKIGLGSCLPEAWKPKAKNEPYCQEKQISAINRTGLCECDPLQMAEFDHLAPVANDGRHSPAIGLGSDGSMTGEPQ